MWIIVWSFKFCHWQIGNKELLIWHFFWHQKENRMIQQDDLYCKSFTDMMWPHFFFITLDTNQNIKCTRNQDQRILIDKRTHSFWFIVLALLVARLFSALFVGSSCLWSPFITENKDQNTFVMNAQIFTVECM